MKLLNNSCLNKNVTVLYSANYLLGDEWRPAMKSQA